MAEPRGNSIDPSLDEGLGVFPPRTAVPQRCLTVVKDLGVSTARCHMETGAHSQKEFSHISMVWTN